MPIQDERNMPNTMLASIAFFVLSAGIPAASATLGATFSDPLLRRFLALPDTVSHSNILDLSVAVSAAGGGAVAFLIMIYNWLFAKTRAELMHDFRSSVGGILAANIVWSPAATLFAFFILSNRNLEDCLNAMKIGVINFVGNFLVIALLAACSYCFYHGRKALRETDAIATIDATHHPDTLPIDAFRINFFDANQAANTTDAIPTQLTPESENQM